MPVESAILAKMRGLVGKELKPKQSEFIGYHKDGWASIPKTALRMDFKEQIDQLHIMTLPDAPFLLTPFPRVPSPGRCAGDACASVAPRSRGLHPCLYWILQSTYRYATLWCEVVESGRLWKIWSCPLRTVPISL